MKSFSASAGGEVRDSCAHSAGAGDFFLPRREGIERERGAGAGFLQESLGGR